MSGFTNFRIPSLTFLLEFSADQKWQTKMTVLIFQRYGIFVKNDRVFYFRCWFLNKMSDFRKNVRALKKSQFWFSGKWSFCIFGNDFRFYLSTMPKQLAVRSFGVIFTTYKGHLWGQQWVIHLYTSLRLFSLMIDFV